MTSRKWIGRSIRRIEDPKLLMGRAGYVDDISFPGMLHVALVHSPFPHARVVGIDTARARKLPGVAAVVTGADAAALCQPLPSGPLGEQMPFRCLAVDKVRYVGEGVVAVAADDRYIAEDACALVEVDYDPLDAVADPLAADAPGAPLLHEAFGSNLVYDREFTFGDVDADFARADRVVRDRLRCHRSGAQPLETVGAVADFDPASGMLTIWANSKILPHRIFHLAEILGIPSNRINSIPIPAGGSFGSKDTDKVIVIAAMMAKLLGRPVKYLEDRVENITNCDSHGPDRWYDAELAVQNDGTICSMRVSVTEDYGAYFGRGTSHHANAFAQLVGPYRISSAGYRIRGVLTNKCQQGAYRGYGAGEANWMLERMVDLAARELDLDPAEIRRRNFINKDQFPYKIPTGNLYDSGDYHQVLDRALELSDYRFWREEQQRLRKLGRYLGIGVASCQLRTVFSWTEMWFLDKDDGDTSTPESVSLSIDAAGNLSAALHVHMFWGNGPETMAAQLVAEEFDVDPRSVTVSYVPSLNALPAVGPGGSRTTPMLAGAIAGAAAKLKEKAVRVFADLNEASAADIEWVRSGLQVRGAPETRIELGELVRTVRLRTASTAREVDSSFESNMVYDFPLFTLPSPDKKDLGVFYPIMAHMCHVAVVEVDVPTGAVTFHKYAVVQDSGTVVNPRSLAGMVIGGTAQGIGTALYEEYVYGEDGQMLSTTYADYLIPTAAEVPEIVYDFVETPSPFTAHGIKGGGESGRMAAPAAVTAAVEDALSPWGVRVREIPATPSRIRQLLTDVGHQV